MGLSFSELSPGSTAGLELGANAGVRQGVGGELQHRAATLTGGGPATYRKGGSSDLASDREGVLYTGVDVQPPQGREIPPQASPFSAVWASAVGPTDPEVSSPGSDSPSILAAEESLVSGGASQERLADLLATTRGDAAAVGTPNRLGTLSQHIGSAPVSSTTAEIDSGENNAETSSGLEPSAKLVDMNLLREALHSHAGRTGALAGGALGANQDAATALNAKGDRVPGISAAAADRLDQAQTANIDDTSAAEFQDAVRNLSNSEREFGRDRRVSREQSEKLGTEKAGAGLNRPAANQQAAPGNPANLYAPTATTANAPTPEAPPVATQNGEAHPNRTTALPQHLNGGLKISAADAGAVQSKHRSEVAFEAELRLQNKAGSTDTAIPNNQPGSASRMQTPTVLEANPARPEVNQRQPLESKVSLEELESAQREAFRRGAGLSGRGESSGGQDQASGNLDRGAQQPAPLAQGTAASHTLPPTAALPKQAAVPAAAQLDALAVEPPAETSSPVRSVAFKIQSEDRGAANVILTDRGGQVHMTVRSSDPALTQSLRSDLGSLAGSFQQQGFEVKLWNPSSGSSAGDDSRANSFDFGQDDLHGQTRHRHSFNDAQRQGHGAEWPEEID